MNPLKWDVGGPVKTTPLYKLWSEIEVAGCKTISQTVISWILFLCPVWWDSRLPVCDICLFLSRLLSEWSQKKAMAWWINVVALRGLQGDSRRGEVMRGPAFSESLLPRSRASHLHLATLWPPAMSWAGEDPFSCVWSQPMLINPTSVVVLGVYLHPNYSGIVFCFLVSLELCSVVGWRTGFASLI